MAEKLNGPGFGFRMVSLTQQANATAFALQEVQRVSADLQAQLRALQEYCENGGHPDVMGAGEAYDDVARKIGEMFG